MILKILIGIAFIGIASGLVGTFAFLRKKTLISDSIAHSLFPGICAGFMLAGSKDPLFLMIGAFLSGWISVVAIDYLVSRSKLSEDTAIALTSTFFFACGSVLLSLISQTENGNQSGLKDFLFGKAATMTEQDVYVFGILAIVSILVVLLFYKPFQVLSFNKDYAKSIGYSVAKIEFILSSITVLTVAIGIQTVGIVLTSALLIAPAAAARYWTDKLPIMLVIASAFGMVSGISGVLISATGEDLPTGPWIVFVLFILTLLTLLFSKKNGWFSIQKKQKRNQRKIIVENVLKIFYQLKESGHENITYYQFLEKRPMDTRLLHKTIRSLVNNGLLSQNKNTFSLTEPGTSEAARVVRFHRLWELYLTQRLNFKEDHIHGTAETIEHLITPEIEKELLKELNFPSSDPHNKEIPY